MGERPEAEVRRCGQGHVCEALSALRTGPRQTLRKTAKEPNFVLAEVRRIDHFNPTRWLLLLGGPTAHTPLPKGHAPTPQGRGCTTHSRHGRDGKPEACRSLSPFRFPPGFNRFSLESTLGRSFTHVGARAVRASPESCRRGTQSMEPESRAWESQLQQRGRRQSREAPRGGYEGDGSGRHGDGGCRDSGATYPAGARRSLAEAERVGPEPLPEQE